jgi:hypothetical protein
MLCVVSSINEAVEIDGVRPGLHLWNAEPAGVSYKDVLKRATAPTPLNRWSRFVSG